MGDAAAREKFLKPSQVACRIAGVFNNIGVRQYGVDPHRFGRIGLADWCEDPKANTANDRRDVPQAAKIAADHGERLAAEGEICWAGMHSWKDDARTCWKRSAMPETRRASRPTWPTRYLYLLGYNAPEEHALLNRANRGRVLTPPTRR